MSETAHRWVALSMTGLAAATVAVLFANGIDATVRYGMLAIALLLGLAAVWAVQRESAGR